MSRVTPVLTTVFTAPSSCYSIITYDGLSFWRGQLSSVGDPNCLPADYSRMWYYYYSPGVCPYKWGSASSLTGTVALVLDPLETNAVCCPDNYFVGTGPQPYAPGLYCGSILTGPVSNVYSTSTLRQGPIPANPSLITVDAATVQNPTVWADIIQVRWKATDSAVLSIISSTRARAGSPSSTQPSTGASSKLPENTGVAQSSQQPTSLSTGAQAGIGVGVAFGVILAVLGAFLLWRRSRRPRKTSPSGVDMMVDNSNRSHHIPVEGHPELDSRAVRAENGELEGSRAFRPASNAPVFELPAKTTQNQMILDGRSADPDIHS